MAAKILTFFASTFLVKVISGQCVGSPYGVGVYGSRRAGEHNTPFGSCDLAASSGGNFHVTSVSPIAPTGLSVRSENTIEGALGVGGQLPFLGTVALEGAFPTAGAGSISYGCGSGTVGITSEGPVATGILGGSPYGSGLPATPGCATGLPATSGYATGIPATPGYATGFPSGPGYAPSLSYNQLGGY